jgi:hypothetical protein
VRLQLVIGLVNEIWGFVLSHLLDELDVLVLCWARPMRLAALTNEALTRTWATMAQTLVLTDCSIPTPSARRHSPTQASPAPKTIRYANQEICAVRNTVRHKATFLLGRGSTAKGRLQLGISRVNKNS